MIYSEYVACAWRKIGLFWAKNAFEKQPGSVSGAFLILTFTFCFLSDKVNVINMLILHYNNILKTVSGSDLILKTVSGSDLILKTVSGSDLILKTDLDPTKASGFATLVTHFIISLSMPLCHILAYLTSVRKF